jgi:predicted O-methyltransferase YrrM
LKNNLEWFNGPDKVGFPIYNVNRHKPGEDIDFKILDVVRTAPALLSSAERLMLFTLIYCVRPKRYLEIGILYGGASLIVSKAMDALNHNGHLLLVDKKPQIDSGHCQQIQHRSTLIEGSSSEILSKAWEVAGGNFDFVLIDATHSTMAALRDANGVLRYLEDGAYILSHDSFQKEVN